MVNAEYALSKGDLNKARILTEQLVDALEPAPHEGRAMQYRASVHWLGLATNARKTVAFAEEPEPLAAADCGSQYVNWSWHLANDNLDQANAIARELWDKGYRHPRMAFYANLAGVTFPPKPSD
jgi:hypothetical protein